jgi:ornithine cyclodeaminase/alanine dehydrogenase-like protein (mu-crystallin family)
MQGMKTLIISQPEVKALLPMGECMDVMAQTLKALSSGNATLPLRTILWLPERVGAMGSMPAYVGGINVMGLKVISVFPGNHGTEFDSHIGAVLLYETAHGQLVAIVDATAITAIRTAAVSGVATRALAREDAGDLTIMGAGTQAATHLVAMLEARDIRRVRVWSRSMDHARAFAERESQRHAIEIEPLDNARLAVAGADLICTTTSSPDPILQGAWLAPGVHINAVGSSVPSARELDTAAVAAAALFVDRKESTLNEAGDFLLAKADGAIGDEHIRGELGDVLLGTLAGRGSDDEITLFKSLGLAVEDVAAAHHVYLKAQERSVGVPVELGGLRDES